MALDYANPPRRQTPTGDYFDADRYLQRVGEAAEPFERASARPVTVADIPPP